MQIFFNFSFINSIKPNAMYNYGLFLYNEKNKAKAAYFFKKAAEKNFFDAQIQYAKMLYSGDGIEKEKETAFKWVIKAINDKTIVELMLFAGIIDEKYGFSRFKKDIFSCKIAVDRGNFEAMVNYAKNTHINDENSIANYYYNSILIDFISELGYKLKFRSFYCKTLSSDILLEITNTLLLGKARELITCKFSSQHLFLTSPLKYMFKFSWRLAMNNISTIELKQFLKLKLTTLSEIIQKLTFNEITQKFPGLIEDNLVETRKNIYIGNLKELYKVLCSFETKISADIDENDFAQNFIDLTKKSNIFII